MYKYIILKDVTIDNVDYHRGDVFKQTFEEQASVFPLSMEDVFQPVEFPSISGHVENCLKVELDYDRRGNNRLIPDDTKVSAEVLVRKNALKEQIKREMDNKLNSLGVEFYPENEKHAFGRKLKAAKDWDKLTITEKNSGISSYLSNPGRYTGDYMILLSEVDLSGTVTQKRSTMDALKDLIIVRDLQWSRLVGILTKDRKSMFNTIDEMSDNVESLYLLNNYSIKWSI